MAHARTGIATGLVCLAMGGALGAAALMPFVITSGSRPTVASAGTATLPPSVAHGRYLVEIADCNGCHTPGFGESGGKIPEADRLVGSPLGFKGPWGTSYPANLRTKAQALDEAQSVRHAGRAGKGHGNR